MILTAIANISYGGNRIPHNSCSREIIIPPAMWCRSNNIVSAMQSVSLLCLNLLLLPFLVLATLYS